MNNRKNYYAALDVYILEMQKYEKSIFTHITAFRSFGENQENIQLILERDFDVKPFEYHAIQKYLFDESYILKDSNEDLRLSLKGLTLIADGGFKTKRFNEKLNKHFKIINIIILTISSFGIFAFEIWKWYEEHFACCECHK